MILSEDQKAARRKYNLRYREVNREALLEYDRRRDTTRLRSSAQQAEQRRARVARMTPEERAAYLAKGAAASRKFRAEQPEKRLLYQRRYAEKHRDRLLEKGRARRGMPTPSRPCPTVCEVCSNPPAETHPGKTLHLDHCHTSGAFRGWLCTNCNTGLGKLGDNVEGVRRALEYLERFEQGNDGKE